MLRKNAAPVEKDSPELQQLISDMFETMRSADGIGLAAPQVDVSIRLFVIDATPMADEDESVKDFIKVFINPKITVRNGGEVVLSEGCLSIPDIREDVRRFANIRIEYYDANFEFHDEEYTGFKARIIQHEYDHLEGILFTDRLSSIRNRLIKGKLNAISKGKFTPRYKMKAMR